MNVTRIVLLAQAMAATLALPACGSYAPSALSGPSGTMLTWDAERDGDPTTYAIDGYTLTFRTDGTVDERAPVLHVKAPSGEEWEAKGGGAFPNISAEFGVGKLDASASGDQVIFAVYSGGAHCCTNIQVLVLAGGRWKTIDMGSWDGGGIGVFPTDVDGNGYADLVFSDDRFAYAFTNYAQSMMPPRLFEIRDGEAVETSASGRYRALYEMNMKEAEAACAMHDNGGCAAFVADAARLGQFDSAWAAMLGNYDAKSDWEYPAKCNAALVAGQCPQGAETKFANFPDALAWFLTDTGYTEPR